MAPKTNASRQRHFAAHAGPRKTGPGTLDDSSLEGPTSYRHMTSEADRDDFEKRKARSKPTLVINPLYPGIDAFQARRLVSGLEVEECLLVHPEDQPGMTQREHVAAVLFINQNTPRDDIDASLSKFQNRYVGNGYKASMWSWISSWRVASQLRFLDLNDHSRPREPFHARTIEQETSASTTAYNRVAPPSFGNQQFRPPTSFAPPGPDPTSSSYRSYDKRVVVKPPNDLKMIRIINRMVMNVLIHGSAFEAALMQRPEVQMDENYSFLFDSHSQGGIWYRWRFFETLTGRTRNNASSDNPELTIFPNQPTWTNPIQHKLPFQYASATVDLKTDPSFDESNYKLLGKPTNLVRDHDLIGTDNDDAEWNFLNPSNRSKLIYMLRDLPSSTAKLRAKVVKRISVFCIDCAGVGRSQEIVQLLVRNVLNPFNSNQAIKFSEDLFSRANTDLFHKALQNKSLMENTCFDHQSTSQKEISSTIKDPPAPQESTTRSPDLIEAMLVGLYVISDLLNMSKHTPVSYAKRYRSLFESEFEASSLFTKLGEAEKEFNLGLLRGERWRARIHTIIEFQAAKDTLSKEAISSIQAEFDYASRKATPLEAIPAARKDSKHEDVSAIALTSDSNSTNVGQARGFKKIGAPRVDPPPASPEKTTEHPSKRQKLSPPSPKRNPISLLKRQFDLEAAGLEQGFSSNTLPNSEPFKLATKLWKTEEASRLKASWAQKRDPRQAMSKRLKAQHERHAKKERARLVRAAVN